MRSEEETHKILTRSANRVHAGMKHTFGFYLETEDLIQAVKTYLVEIPAHTEMPRQLLYTIATRRMIDYARKCTPGSKSKSKWKGEPIAVNENEYGELIYDQMRSPEDTAMLLRLQEVVVYNKCNLTLTEQFAIYEYLFSGSTVKSLSQEWEVSIDSANKHLRSAALKVLLYWTKGIVYKQEEFAYAYPMAA